MSGTSLMALLALASYAADTGPGKFLGGKAGAVLIADLESGGRFAETAGGAGDRAAVPASVFKTATAAALLREGRPAALACPGCYTTGGRREYCSLRTGHGRVGLTAAFAQSCNFYFRSRLPDRETLLSVGLELGLVQAQALPDLVDAPLADLAVGLAPALALTPAELLNAAAGWPSGPDWEALRPLLAACVSEGTCAAARVPGVPVGGKTGTAPAPDGSGATSGWFVGFAPVEAPKAVVVVFLDRGQGKEAAAVGGEALSWWFRRSSASR